MFDHVSNINPSTNQINKGVQKTQIFKILNIKELPKFFYKNVKKKKKKM